MRKRELLELQEYYFKQSRFFFTGAVVFFVLSFLQDNAEKGITLSFISIFLSIISSVFRHLGKNPE